MNNENQHTILWHDYETWGVRPSVDFPVQFAAIRTDEELNILENERPMNWLCQIPHDYLPHPQACLVTGISPQMSLHKGMTEPAFAAKVNNAMMRKGTCVAGYNSMKFDEEVSRHLFFRNMYPVYDREFKNNNSKWDVIDLVRAAYALRPEGIEWPYYDNGKPCFKLEQLSKANNIEHDNAHDALSDVYATIAMAKLIKNTQPKLYDYYWQLRNKHKVDELLSQFQANMFVHINAYVPSENGCCTLIMPVCRHPTNHNAVICIDLAGPITPLLHCSASEIRESLYRRTPIEEDDSRPKFFTIAINKCPFVAPKNTLSANRATTLNIDITQCENNYRQLSTLAGLAGLCTQIFTPESERPIPENIDESLYAMEFPTAADTQLMGRIREAEPEQLIVFKNGFESGAYNALFARYRGRNFPMTLEEREVAKWQQYLHMRFTTGNKKACLSLNEYLVQIESLMTEHTNNPKYMQVLHALVQYGKHIAGEYG